MYTPRVYSLFGWSDPLCGWSSPPSGRGYLFSVEGLLWVMAIPPGACLSRFKMQAELIEYAIFAHVV